jgi:hypothetical protein
MSPGFGIPPGPMFETPSLLSLTYESLVPILPMIILEYILFFNFTLHDIHLAKESQFNDIRSKISKEVSDMKDKKKQVATVKYLKKVHEKVAPDYVEYQGEIEDQKKRMQLRGKVLIFSLVGLLVIGALFAWSHISWPVLGIQTLLNTIVIGAFQVFFYFQIGKKYNYDK